MIYQIISAILTVAVAGYTAWKNNDFTRFARAAGKIFDALKDGKITVDEVESIVKAFSNKPAEEGTEITAESESAKGSDEAEK